MEIAAGYDGVEAMTQRFRTAVDCEVLGAGRGFEIARIIPLQARHERRGHLPRQERIFAPGLLTATPARVAEDIDVGRPEGQALIPARLPLAAQRRVVLGTGLVPDGAADAADQGGIPGGGQADGLGKYRRAPVAGHAVERLVRVVVGGDAQPGDCLRPMAIWPIFSGSVMAANRSATRAATG